MKFLLTIIVLMMIMAVWAVPVTQDQAQTVARNWTAKWGPVGYNSKAIVKITPVVNSNVTELYLFEFESGFVLTSADDSVIPILAYGYNTNVSQIDDNPAFGEYLNTLQQEIRYIRSNQMDNSETSAKWQTILSNNFTRDETRSVMPLLSTRWDQGWPYNMYCPSDAAGPGGHVYAGCVATAMAQVMKYWNWPVTGTGSHSYYAQGYGTQTANFGATTYQWAQMPNSVHEQNDAVARLLYHLGVSVNMMYAPDGSGAYSASVPPALMQYFSYNPGAQQKMKSNFSSATWEQMLRDELNSARPMYYSGSGPGGGHAFVCDGYQGTNYFHFNWGWSGSYDGYFYVSNLNPGSTFNNNQGAVMYVFPLNYDISGVQMSLQSTNCSVGDTVPVSVITYPIMPAWNVNNMSFTLEYDETALAYLGYDTIESVLDGSNITINLLQPGRITYTVSNQTAISGSGTLLKALFQPLIPGSFNISLDDVSLNTTPVSLLSPVTISASAIIGELQNSVIDLLNAMYIQFNTVATIPMTTTFLLPTWSVQTASFTLHYPQNQVSWEGYETEGCLSYDSVIEVTNTIPGLLLFNLDFGGTIAGSGNLIKLKFRAIGNIGSASLVTLTVSDFFYNQTLVQNLQPGYIVLLPVTANEENVTIPENRFSFGPNPFYNEANLAIELVKANQPAEISVFNLKGQLIRTLYNSDLKGTQLSLSWNGKDNQDKIVPAGIYLIRIKSESFNQTIKAIRLK